MHGVDGPAVVLDVHAYDVALLDHEHRDVWEKVAVDRPPESGLAVDEAGTPSDRVGEAAIRMGRVEGQRSRAAVPQEVEDLRWHRGSRRTRPDDECANAA